MVYKHKHGLKQVPLFIIGVFVLLWATGIQQVFAITPIPTPEPKPGSHGLEARKKQAPPTQGATITTPGNGATFTTSPITVNGICPTGLLVQLYNNGVMVGSVICTNGSFSLQISLFAGVNELSAVVFDDLEQAGPTSNIVTITYTDTNFTAFGALITLTSVYGRRSAPTGQQLNWPLQLSGGTGPYAFSIDWGDGSAAQLKSQSLAGLVTIDHVYKKAGIYLVNTKATDVNGVSAFLQTIAVSNGKAEPTPEEKAAATTKIRILWIPAVIASALLFPTYWLGKRSQMIKIRNKMMKERDNYNQK